MRVEPSIIEFIPIQEETSEISSYFILFLLLSFSLQIDDPARIRHQFPELAQTHVHQVSDAIQTSHLLLSPSPPALNLSQNQILQMNQHFAAGCQSIGVSASPSVLPKNTQD